MSKELATLQDIDIAELMRATGQQTAQDFTGIPRLYINRDGEDEAGNTVPVGAYAIAQNGVTVYSKTARFRPLINAYQYSIYDAGENKYTNKSIIFKSWSDEAIDENGGVACGKIAKKKLESATPEILEAQKKIKCYRLVYGLVSMDGVNGAGEKVSLVDVPCRMKLSGINFMPIQAAFDTLNKKKQLMMWYYLDLATKRQKSGTNTFYEMVVSLDSDNPVKADRENFAANMETIKVFQEEIDKENAGVADKYRAAKRKASLGDDAEEAIAVLDGDFYEDSVEDIS